jgi:hypothetical protein
VNNLLKILVANLIFISSSFAVTNKQPFKVWVDQDKKVVHFLPNPVLKLTLAKLEVDEDYWAQLSINYSYADKAGDYEENGAELKRKYPGYKFAKVLVNDVINEHLSIPVLGLDSDIKFMLSMDGPYYRETVFVPKNKMNMVEKAIKDPKFIKITGNLKINVPVLKTLEKGVLPATTCDVLLTEDQTVYSLLGQFSQVVNKISEMNLKYESTKVTLKNQVLSQCLAVPSAVQIGSFAELMNLKLEKKVVSNDFIAETKGNVFSDVQVPINGEDLSIEVNE